MKKYLAMILALVMALSLVACGDKQDDAADNNGDTATGSVYWLNFKPEADATLQKVAAMYTEKTGVPVTVVTAASGTYNETLTAEMDKSAPPTLFVVGNQAAVETWGDYCYNLSGTDIANQLNTDAYNLYDADGKLCSIGYCYECYGIIVNEDLLEKAGYTLGDITNFETLKAVAEDIHARASELGFDAFTSSSMSEPRVLLRVCGRSRRLEGVPPDHHRRLHAELQEPLGSVHQQQRCESCGSGCRRL